MFARAFCTPDGSSPVAVGFVVALFFFLFSVFSHACAGRMLLRGLGCVVSGLELFTIGLDIPVEGLELVTMGRSSHFLFHA